MKTFHRVITAAIAIATLTALAACGDETADDAGSDVTSATAATETADDRFPDVIGAAATETDVGVWLFEATLSSPYDTAARYADAWRVVGDDGVVYGLRELTHDHESEQPFTRSLSGVEIPDTVAVVTIEGRDQANGWGGDTSEVVLRP